VITILPLATAAAAGAGDKIKWSKSKKIEYISPDEDPAQFDKLYTDYFERYTITWGPYTNNEIDFMTATYQAWPYFASYANKRLRMGQVSTQTYEEGVRKEREFQKKHLTFTVTMKIKYDSFWETATADYWRFYIPVESGDVEPKDVNRVELLNPDAITGVSVIEDYSPIQHKLCLYGGPRVNERTFKIVFENPYADAEHFPSTLKLIVASDKVTRGFEWRFKED
jgi:hypothetical protein